MHKFVDSYAVLFIPNGCFKKKLRKSTGLFRRYLKRATKHVPHYRD